MADMTQAPSAFSVKQPDAAGMTPEQLAAAFAEFMRASDRLTAAYAQLEARAERLTERLDVLMQALPVAVVVLNAEGEVVEANETARQWFGTALTVGTAWQRFAQQLRPTEAPDEVLWSAPDGEKRLTLTWSQLPDQGGELVVVQDVTEATRLREAMARQERLAAMGELVAGLAHQLRTPLAAALLFLDHLTTPGLDEARRIELAGRVKARLHRMEQLIADMLIFARGGLKAREPISLPHLFTQWWSTVEPLAQAQKVVLERLFAPQADAPVVIGDERALLGALINLAENALAVQQGQAAAWVGLGARATADQWEIVVADHGPGIPDALRARLFTPFFTTRPDGTGLGLAIAHEVVTAHGGTIEVRSEPGEGTTFIVRLPCTVRSRDV
ncbi:PAS domain-containing sensor histidine kinase [Hydrogenophilus thermoluteolus]|uniref:histidine kinase n=2 Tax=Hydrogenophilus thermoluteolus TaxID=297 RepID=A0A2Z6DZ22_HYDTE|nr:PAS domain-containing sensor histidine kinase [Hydrogenophilus thermoluteolus]